MEYFKMSKKFKGYKRIKMLIWTVVIFLPICGAMCVGSYFWGKSYGYYGAGILLFLRIIAVVIHPIIEYIRWNYRIDDKKIEIKRGILHKNYAVIPVSKIQHLVLKDGPLMRAFSLSNVYVFTAGGVYVIKGLEKEKAESISEGLKNDVLKRLRAIDEANEILKNNVSE